MAHAVVKGLASTVTLCLVLATAAGELRTVSATLVDGHLVGAENTIRVVEGETVVLRWTTDHPADLHLHGYDVLARVTPDSPGEMRFVAHTPGRFPIEYHASDHGHRVVLYVEVHPD